jgi:hypothetical protein
VSQVHSLSLTKKIKEERKGESCATTPSDDTTVLSRKELRKLITRDLFSWKIIKSLPSWSCAHKRREWFKRRRIITQLDQIQWSFWEIMEQGDAFAHVMIYSSGHWWWNQIHQLVSEPIYENHKICSMKDLEIHKYKKIQIFRYF